MNFTKKSSSMTERRNLLLLATIMISLIVTSGLVITTTITSTQATNTIMTTPLSSSLPKAFAQQQTSQNASTLSGVITSTQLNNAGAPEWLAAGSWILVTDKPIFGGGAAGGSPPTVKNFSAIVDMAAFANGSMFHTHRFYDFKQSHVLFNPNNSTAINGTMTITTEQGTTQNVMAYLHFQNNAMFVWVNPGQINNHFGPTPINGLIVNPQQIAEIRSMEAPQLQQSMKK